MSSSTTPHTLNDIHAKTIHIPPVSLLAYKNYSMSNEINDIKDTTLTEQAKLDEDLNSINDYISKINHDYRKTSVRWDKDLKSKQKLRGRTKIKVMHEQLYDGVHLLSLI